MFHKFYTVIFCGLSVLAPMAHASNVRSWVSRTGSDANDCSKAHPCATFQAAHDATQPGGEVDVLDPGDYGSLLISRPITLDGGNMGYIYYANSKNPSTVGILVQTPPAGVVIIRNLSISPANDNISADGIAWNQGKVLQIENVSINGFSVGISSNASPYDAVIPRELFITDCKVRNASVFGMIVDNKSNPNSHTTITRTVVENIGVEGSGNGIVFEGGSAHVTNTVVSQVTLAGVTVIGGELNMEDSSISYAHLGIYADGKATARLAGNNVHDTAIALTASSPASILSFGNNRIAGNASGETPTSTIPLR